METQVENVVTTKELNSIGIILMWVATLLLCAVIIMKPITYKLICLAAFLLAFWFYKVAEQSTGIFEYNQVQKNHKGRKFIIVVGMLITYAGILHLSIYANEIVFPIVMLALAATATFLRVVGRHPIQNQGESK